MYRLRRLPICCSLLFTAVLEAVGSVNKTCNENRPFSGYFDPENVLLRDENKEISRWPNQFIGSFVFTAVLKVVGSVNKTWNSERKQSVYRILCSILTTFCCTDILRCDKRLGGNENQEVCCAEVHLIRPQDQWTPELPFSRINWMFLGILLSRKDVF